MNTKAKLIAAATKPVIRRKVLENWPPGSAPEDKAPPGWAPEETPLDQTQEIVCDDEPLMDEDEESDGTLEEFNARAEELFMDKLDRWFAEFGPKLYDLGLSKHLNRMEKKKSKEESSETSHRPHKKRR